VSAIADDRKLAEALRDAEISGDLDAIVEAENAICDRLGLPLDWTEQGLNQEAADAITAFCLAQGVT
jgi:hypothetical protein